ncbi:hypothetical protein [Sphingorhabdus sp.]|uniref:hypothetical protein n=1 Tax=Sphingorhabdus sp. TaxID=1902408 RepID=UPI002FDB8EAB
MSEYPAKMAIIAPNFVIADAKACAPDRPYFVYIDAFAVLKVERQGRGFRFSEARHVSDLQSGTDSVGVLDALTSQLDPDDSLAGYRLDRIVAGLIRVPDGEPRDEDALPSLQRLKAALANDIRDAEWYDRVGSHSLEQLASDYALPADWHSPNRQLNPCVLERELSAKAQSVWLLIAHEWLSAEDLRRAMADYDHWRTLSSIV